MPEIIGARQTFQWDISSVAVIGIDLRVFVPRIPFLPADDPTRFDTHPDHGIVAASPVHEPEQSAF